MLVQTKLRELLQGVDHPYWQASCPQFPGCLFNAASPQKKKQSAVGGIAKRVWFRESLFGFLLVAISVPYMGVVGIIGLLHYLPG